MHDQDMPPAIPQARLDRLANDALGLWDLPTGAYAELINISENTTYLVRAPNGFRAVLRVHRERYHSRRAIECELAWIDALADTGKVATPRHYAGRDGQSIQVMRAPGAVAPRFLVLFEFVDGVHPDESGDLRSAFEQLGEIAAQTHLHAMAWRRPAGFERLIWDADAVFGPDPTWGNWRDAPHVDEDIRRILEQVETVVRRRLGAFGTSPDRYGLIHADMRLANLLIADGAPRLIDFDDCGFGWFLYDFAAAISFMEDSPQIPALRSAWLRGYRRMRALPDADAVEIDTFVMLRRMALLAWIGSHIDAPEPQVLAPDFARVTAELGRAYLHDHCIAVP